jgi:menaquinone-dependent protoporphyrinogen oxidase
VERGLGIARSFLDVGLAAGRFPHAERREIDAELAQFPWFAPCACEVFGGRFDPTKIRFPLRPFLKKIPATDFRDWDAIRAWAGGLAGKE